jgi:ribosomal-protein-alanine N-acetyltransferase
MTDVPLGIVRLEGPRVIVRSTTEDDALLCLAYFDRNRAHLEPWEPTHDDTFYTQAYWHERMRSYDEERARGTLQRMCIFERSAEGVLAGLITLMAVTPRPPVWNARVGYSLDAKKEGQGLMSEALALVIRHAFDDLHLKRLLAGYVPQNSRSARVLERAGFVKEGYHREYLFVGGKWEDHVETGLINRGWKLA